MGKRVVVTGIGLITPLGVGNDATWSSLCEGVPGVGRVSTFDPSDLKTQIAGEVKDFDPTLYMEYKDAKRNDRFIQLSIASTKLALEDAGLEVTDDISERTGTFIGSGIGGMKTFYDTVLTMENKGPGRVSPFFIPKHSDQHGFGIRLHKVQRQGSLTALPRPRVPQAVTRLRFPPRSYRTARQTS